MIHFSHGNGFPAETYHQIIKGLKESQEIKYNDIGYISCMGHDDQYAIGHGWKGLMQELLDYIKNNYNQPVIAVGHSLGGVLSYFAACQQPELFKAVILLDSPLYSYWKLKTIRLIKYLGLIDYVTPARNTKNRRMYWDSYEQAIEHFGSKEVFKNYDKRCLRDYAYFGTEKVVINNHHKVKLKFDPIREWQIYRTLPTYVPDSTKLAEYNIPCGLIYGEFSKTVYEKDAKNMHKKYKFWLKKLDNCGHLFPFEKPDATVAAIKDFIELHNL